ncbi:MAG: ABC transporter permease [Cellulomonadaceae bacterium]|jgi:simple sugar transport system permease protein|nr:ABC transporter permease [Cellulomonadaceae bacterium]
MSTVTVDPSTVLPDEGPIEHRIVEKRSVKTATILAVATALLALLLVASPRQGKTNFQITLGNEFFSIGEGGVVAVPAVPFAWICVAIMAVLTVVAFVLSYRYSKFPGWASAVFGLLAVAAFLSWAGAGAQGRLNVVGLIGNAILVAIPLVFGALGGVIGERAGVVNIAIEAQLLMAAFTGAVVGSLTANAWVGLLAAILAGAGVAAILGVFAINYRVEQVIVGVVLNVLIIGVTTFLFSAWLQTDMQRLNSTLEHRFPDIAIPLLSRIPIIGPALFNRPVIVYIMYVAVAAVWFALYRTRWGLRTRAVGEHPKAADTVGIKVNATRWLAVLIAGAIVGIGGASYTLVSNPSFNREMTAGFGYIALAAVIFGNWDPIRASLAGLLFGFAINLQSVLSVIGSPVPSQFMLMLPYVVTLLAVAGLVGKSRAPAADGVAYTVEGH